MGQFVSNIVNFKYMQEEQIIYSKYTLDYDAVFKDFCAILNKQVLPNQTYYPYVITLIPKNNNNGNIAYVFTTVATLQNFLTEDVPMNRGIKYTKVDDLFSHQILNLDSKADVKILYAFHEIIGTDITAYCIENGKDNQLRKWCDEFRHETVVNIDNMAEPIKKDK